MKEETIISILNDMLKIHHPLNNIAVLFTAFIPNNEIWLMKKQNFHGKKVLFVPESKRKIWEQMEEKEGIRAERYGLDLKTTYHPIPNPLHIEHQYKQIISECIL